MTDVISEAIPCSYCGHRYKRPCSTPERRDQCGNWEWIQEGRPSGLGHKPLPPPAAPPPPPAPVDTPLADMLVKAGLAPPAVAINDAEALRIAAELDKMLRRS